MNPISKKRLMMLVRLLEKLPRKRFDWHDGMRCWLGHYDPCHAEDRIPPHRRR